MNEDEWNDRMLRFSDRQITVEVLNMLTTKQNIKLLEILERNY